MKKRTNKFIGTSLLGLSILGTFVIAIDVSTLKSEAVGFTNGGQKKTIETSYDKYGTALKIKFNTYYNNGKGTPQSRFYGGNKEFYRQVYFPENSSLPGGFVWYSPVPNQQEITSLSQTDMSNMLENRQTALGSGGNYLVKEASGKSYKYNLKYGAVDPWVGKFLGNNTGTKTIQYGSFKGKKYEWRFLGYTEGGAAVANPYFPDDSDALAQANISTRQANDAYWANKNWIANSWELQDSLDAFGVSEYNDRDQKAEWIKEYFFPDHPAFKKENSNAYYWADRMMPMSDPSKETGVWLMWHWTWDKYQDKYGKWHDYKHNWYTTFITTPPKQTNLRLVDYKIYDSQNRLVAQETRDANDYYKVNSTVDIKQEYVHKGETYRIEADVKNMNDKKVDIQNTAIQLEHMYSLKAGKMIQRFLGRPCSHL